LVFLQFEEMPDAARREALLKAGVVLQGYVSGNAFLATIKGSPAANLLKQQNVRALVPVTAQQKMQPSLALGRVPDWAQRGSGQVELWISFTTAFSPEDVREELTR